jgi:CNT family concentrative nucleoside transporter
MLIGFTAAIALFNFLITQPQQWAGVANPVTIDMLLGWINAPFAYLMGVPWADCVEVGQAFGKRIVFTEFIGYLDLTQLKDTLDPRSFAIGTFAICGFANFASIAIQIGGIGSLAPDRRKDLASLGLRAMVGGILVSYINACIAGFFI